MRWALDVPNFGDFADIRLIADVAAAAEGAGWDGFFIWDHIAPAFMSGTSVPTADVTVALTAIALSTERIRFGALVTPLPRRRVQKVAREFASLDQLSGGRLVCGVGLGFPPDTEYEAFGEPSSEVARAQHLDESLEVLSRLWSGAPVDFDGERVVAHAAAFEPRPVQQPRVPIWVAATWPGRQGPIQRAARWDGIAPIPPDPEHQFLTPDDVRAVLDAVGRDEGFDLVANGGPDAIPADYERAGATWWLEVAFTRDDALARARAGPQR
jgi:alkanesulfonate monooxygenase SsuD/methylene tetrahydromethanopterin reductase-like flavin-dependent oxidoreductase (luciferase family)